MKDGTKDETIFGDAWPYSKAKTSLLKAASIVIRERGPRAATLKNIAAKAGVTEPAIFRHFDGVDGLFESMFSASELFRRRFVQFFAEGGLSGLPNLESAVLSCLQTAKDHPEYASVMANPNQIFRQYQELVPKLEETDAALIQAAIRCFKEAKASGQLVAGADPESLATIAIGTLSHTLQLWSRNVDGYDPVKEGKKSIKLLVALCGKAGTGAAAEVEKGAKVKRR